MGLPLTGGPRCSSTSASKLFKWLFLKEQRTGSMKHVNQEEKVEENVWRFDGGNVRWAARFDPHSSANLHASGLAL